MMRQMRENTKWIMLITALAFVTLMVFEWGMDLSGRSGAQATGGEMGRVNGEPVTLDEYNVVYRNLRQQQEQASEAPISPAMDRQIEQAAWDQVVTQKLLGQEMRRRGIRVTDAEVLQAARVEPPPELRTAPIFQTNGEFDIAKYQQFLASPAIDDQFLQQLEAYYRDIIPRSKLYFQTTAGAHLSDGQLWRLYKDANDSVSVRFVAFTPDALVPDGDVSVDEAAIRSYYNDHRDDFLRPAQATVRYITINSAPEKADSAAALQRAVEYRQAIAGGESFEAVARRASGEDSISRQYGERFSVTRTLIGPTLEEPVFRGPIGQVSDPVMTPAGYYLIQVESRGGDSAQIRQILVPIERSIEAEDALMDRIDELETLAAENGLESAARSMQLPVQTAELSEAVPILPGVGAAEDAIDWALEDAQPGDVSDAFETESSYYLVELVSRRDEGTLSLEEATPTIRAYLLRQAKVARARERLADAERAARSGQSLDQIASANGTTVQQAGPFSRGDFVPGLGRLNPAIGAAFGLRPGQTSGLVEANGQLYLIQSVSRKEADRAVWEAQKPLQRMQVQQALADARWQQYLTALRESAEVVDNRRALAQQNAAAAAAAR